MVSEPSETSGIPDSALVRLILRSLLGGRTRKMESALDVACGSGRIFEPISEWADQVDGVEIETSAANAASTKNYREVINTDVCEIRLDKKYNLIVCWAAFEVLDQPAALKVFAEHCHPNAYVVISGKHFRYLPQDHLAVEAEIAAKAKGFKQYFVEAANFEVACNSLGFTVLETLIFERRGDLAKGMYRQHLNHVPAENFYEFVVLLRKSDERNPQKYPSTIWSHSQSQTLSELLANDL